jgi:hypothetical protein
MCVSRAVLQENPLRGKQRHLRVILRGPLVQSRLKARFATEADSVARDVRGMTWLTAFSFRDFSVAPERWQPIKICSE